MRDFNFERATSATSVFRSSPELMTIGVLIPVWQPPADLPELVENLILRGFGRVVVVNDGSHEEYRPLFNRLKALDLADIVEHSQNLGKGRALKSGLSFLQKHVPALIGAVTADADGQHLPDDIQRVGLRLLSSGERCVIGARTFDRSAPFKNRMGNRFTAMIFRTLTKCRVSDTQTGLRGLPRSQWKVLLGVPGERYEYETAMLVQLCRSGQPPLEVPISTVYLNGNRSTHFRPFRDSFKIYGALLRALLRPRTESS